MVRDGKDVYYRNVNLFVERILDLAATKGHDAVKTNLNTCLRGTALIWYTAELTSLERSGLRQIDLTERWITSLKRRFKPNHSAAVSSLVAERYSVADVRSDREPASYIQQVVSHAKDASFDSTFHQLTWAWRNLDPELKRDIAAPDEKTTLAQFLEQVEAKKEVWQEIYRIRTTQSNHKDRDDRGRAGGRTGQYSNNSPLAYQNTGGRFARGFQSRPFQAQGQGSYYPNYANQNQYYPSYNQQGYRNQNPHANQPSNQPLSQPRLTAPPPPRLIAAPPPPVANNQQSNQPGGYGSKPTDAQR